MIGQHWVSIPTWQPLARSGVEDAALDRNCPFQLPQSCAWITPASFAQLGSLPAPRHF